MEEAKAEVERKVSTLIKFIQNKNNIPKVTRKELLSVVNDLHDQCHSLCSVVSRHGLDSGIGGTKGKPCTTASSSPASYSDLEYYSSEETEASVGNLGETLSSDYAVVLRKLQEAEQRNEEFGRQVSNLKQETHFLRDQNMELAGDMEGKRNEDREHSQFQGLMTKGEATLLRNQKKELELELERKTYQVSETRIRLKRLEVETEERAKAEFKTVEAKEDVGNKVHKLEVTVDALQAQREELSEEIKSKIIEIDCLKEENQKLHTRIAEIDSVEKEREMKNTEDKSKKQNSQGSDQHKLVTEQEDTIHRLTMEIKDQQKLVKEQKEAIEKLSEEQKLLKRWSFGSKLINTKLLERKMEEVAGDFRMKMEDHIRILYRRIHVAEQIHLESKNSYIKSRDDNNNQTQENRGDHSVSETQIKKIKEMVEKGLAGPEMAIKKLEEGEALVERVTRVSKEIESARKWVKEKKSETKHEVETLEAKLECREAQECLLKEKLSKLETKLAEEGTGKLSLEKAMRRIKKLEIGVKERDIELMSLGEEKREAIRQLCVLMDYQRCRYDDLKTSIFKVALHA